MRFSSFLYNSNKYIYFYLWCLEKGMVIYVNIFVVLKTVKLKTLFYLYNLKISDKNKYIKHI